MNPISHPQIAKNTHREYEARYSSRYLNNKKQPESVSPLGRSILALALSGLSVSGVIAMLTNLV